jgi:maleylpyruvate isomerase
MAMNSSRDPADLDGLEASAVALNRTVDALSTDELAHPSLLPGWSRAHVVAHLALNGQALARVLDTVNRGEPAAMYESDEQRNAEIDELCQLQAADLRDRLLAATTEFDDAVRAMEQESWSGSFGRTPGDPTWPAATIVETRRREVEIHHADLGTSYTHHDWPEDFVVELLDVVCLDQASCGPFRVEATDLGRVWSVGGDSGPTVSGTGGSLGWWLTGRSHGEELSGEVPALGAWRRAAAVPPA